MFKKIALVLSALVLAGCGNISNHKTHADFTEFDLKENGKPLHCVNVNNGVSCDWVAYHQR
jgi:hypothetical protein